MTEAKELAFPLRLTIGELAFLMSLTGVQRLIGLETDGLFPSDADRRDDLLLSGRAQLEQDGWLRHDPATGRYDLNRELTTVITTIAAPDAVVMTTLQGADQPRQSVVHYLTGLPVEVAFDGHRWRSPSTARRFCWLAWNRWM